MAVPELVVQEGVRLAWKLLEEYPRTIGFLLRYLPIEKQDKYKTMIKDDRMSNRVVFAFQKGGSPPIPGTTVLPQSKQEEINFIGDGGLDSYDPETFPYPPMNPEDYPDIDQYYGLMFGNTTQAQYLYKDGEQSTSRTKFHDQIEVNRGIQRSWGDEQRKELNGPQKLFNKMTQFIEGRSVIDKVSMGIQVRAQNPEKALVYADLLMALLREYSFWFHGNGLMNPIYSMGPLIPDNQMSPSGSGEPPMMREISFQFQHEDRFHEIRPVIAKFIMDINMVTENPDGTTDTTQVASVSTGTSVGDDPDPFTSY